MSFQDRLSGACAILAGNLRLDRRLDVGKDHRPPGSYHTAFAHGIGWNLLNLAMAVLLLGRVRAIRINACDGWRHH